MPIDRNGGQYITANPQQPTQSSAPGIWDIDEQGSAQAAGRWPLPPNVVQRSLRFNSADSTYLNRTPASATNRTTWTWSAWIKRSALTTQQMLFYAAQDANNRGGIVFEAAGTLRFFNVASAAVNCDVVTTPVYRDASAWYHLVIALDTTQGTSTDRLKFYVNGVQVTTFGTTTYPGPSAQFFINSNVVHSLGRESTTPEAYLSGYMAEINFVDGQALTPSSFGQTDAQTGQWIPRVYSGSYGTNGFRLQFLDNSGTTATTLGKDTSGMGNNWTPNNFSVAAGSGNDSLRDVPMNYYSPDNGLGGEVIGNYCTLNPLIQGVSLVNGNLDQNASTVVNFGTVGVASGKWYYEATITAQPSGGLKIGVGASGTTSELGQGSNGWAIICQSNADNGKVVNNGTLGTDYTNFAVNDVVMVAFDMDSGKLYFGQNGVWLNSASPASGTGAIYTNLSGTLFPASTAQTGGAFSWNFGQRPFAYTAPSGFKALCTQNFSAPRIGNVAVAQANDYFNTVLYNGTGSSLSVTGTGFQPDLVWIKSRSAATDHALYDAVRGVQNQLESNTTTAETAETTGLTAFGADGFTVGSLAQVNTSAATYVAWQWNAGGSTVTNTSGSITSSVRANQTPGFSVVTYTGNGTSGATVAHGLGVAPAMVIVKKRSISGTAGWWATYHSGLSANTNLMLNDTAGANGTGTWTQGIVGGVTASVFTLTSGGLGAANVNDNGASYVAYCFAAVPGFSAFGSYTGNGSADGPFVYVGFRPRWLLIKSSTYSPTNWILHDTARQTYNPDGNLLLPDSFGAEIPNSSADYIDILSNGFKNRNSGEAQNRSGTTYIYAAFAEIPFQFANAR